MISLTSHEPAKSLKSDEKTYKRLTLNHTRNKAQDHTQLLDEAAGRFRYEDCKDAYWNPERFSLLWGTPAWDQASPSQRVLLNQLYWVAYYSQIVSAEIATIFYNQTAGAALYGLDDFRLVCDTLDLESSQERAHIHAFQSVSKAVEEAIFGTRLFSYAMRGPYAETMVHGETSPLKAAWKAVQLRSYSVLSSSSPFIGCQYFTVRGVRTLNGKLVQHQLSQFYSKAEDREAMPLPSAISFYHFMDESFHFNSSMIISKEVIRSLAKRTRFEEAVANVALRGCQRDHFHFSTAINGIFWHDPALFGVVDRLFQSPAFGMSAAESREMIRRCFTEENEGMHASQATHRTAHESYKTYLADIPHVWADNREMRIMGSNSLERHLATNRRAFEALGTN